MLARVAFPDSLSTCPVPFLDVEEGLCVYEIPMLGPLGDLPLHPGGNSATLVARKLSEDEPVQLMRCLSESYKGKKEFNSSLDSLVVFLCLSFNGASKRSSSFS